MAGLIHTLASMDDGGIRIVYGTAHWDGSHWWANVGGNLLDPRWLDPIQPKQGGKIVVGLISDGRGQSSALVLGGYTDQPRPSTGTVLVVGASEIVFTGEDGTVYTTDRFIGTYAVSDLIYITWDAATPTIIGKIPTITVTPPPGLVPEAPTAASGDTKLIAAASDTFGVGGWGRWATSQNGGEDVYAGTWYGYTLTGSWFYGPPKPELAGKTVNRIEFRLPQRLIVGASGSATVHIYAHTSSSRPGGDVSRVVGPFDVVVGHGSGPVLVELPLTFASVLAAGGGISIAGDPYVGFASRLDDAESGKITMYWSS